MLIFCYIFLEAYLSQIQSIYTQEQNYLDAKDPHPKVVNFGKFRSISKVISELRRFQKARYVLHPQFVIQCFLLNITALSKLELNSLATLTHNREEILGYHSKADKIPEMGKILFDLFLLCIFY